ncbi:MAG: hypothetical protein R6U11_01360 [Bacteroidales bacterium]
MSGIVSGFGRIQGLNTGARDTTGESLMPVKKTATSKLTDEGVITYSPLGELIVIHPLASEWQKNRYIGAKQLSGKIPDLISSDRFFR